MTAGRPGSRRRSVCWATRSVRCCASRNRLRSSPPKRRSAAWPRPGAPTTPTPPPRLTAEVAALSAGRRPRNGLRLHRLLRSGQPPPRRRSAFAPSASASARARQPWPSPTRSADAVARLHAAWRDEPSSMAAAARHAADRAGPHRAHPTEAKRRTVLSSCSESPRPLRRLDDPDLLPRARRGPRGAAGRDQPRSGSRIATATARPAVTGRGAHRALLRRHACCGTRCRGSRAICRPRCASTIRGWWPPPAGSPRWPRGSAATVTATRSW